LTILAVKVLGVMIQLCKWCLNTFQHVTGVTFVDFEPVSDICRLQTADCRLQTANCRLPYWSLKKNKKLAEWWCKNSTEFLIKYEEKHQVYQVSISLSSVNGICSKLTDWYELLHIWYKTDLSLWSHKSPKLHISQTFET